MIKITTNNELHYMYLAKLYTNSDIFISVFDDKTFEGSHITLTKEKAKELVEKLNLLIHEQ